MNHQDVVQQVNCLLNEGFEIPLEKLKPEAGIYKDLGLDSLDGVDLMVRLEEQLKVKVDSERMASVRTLEDIYKLVGDLITPAPISAQL